MNSTTEFNRVTFGLPVETFRISAHIALDERLPIVTEFVLRLLRICSRVRKLRNYVTISALLIVKLSQWLSR